MSETPCPQKNKRKLRCLNAPSKVHSFVMWLAGLRRAAVPESLAAGGWWANATYFVPGPCSRKALAAGFSRENVPGFTGGC
jgi:hypothetical protein